MDNKLNILMISPMSPLSFWSMKHFTRLLGKKSLLPPLGLLTLASLLPKQWNVRVVDLNVRSITEDDYQFADYVFLTGMIVQEESFLRTAKEFQERGIPVVAGGPYVASCYKEITCVDHFILGEAENTLFKFVDDLQNKHEIQDVYQANEYPDIRTSPTPRYDLVNMDDYHNMPMEVSRGCPHDCEFCCITTMLGRKPRYKTSKQVTGQLNAIYNAGHRGMVFIVDDNFAGNFRKAKKILLNIISWQEKHDFPFVFLAQATIDIAKDKALVGLLRRALFDTIFFGIETPSKEALRETRKNQNLNISLTEAVSIIHRHGISVSSGFIIGFDSDDESIFDRQIDFIARSAIARPMFGILNAFPGSKLSDRLEKENRMLSRSNGSNETMTNFKTVLRHDSLLKGYLKILETVWNPHNYFDRLLRALVLMKDQYIISNKKLTLKECIITIRFLTEIMTSWYRNAFVKFVIQAMRKKIPLKLAISIHLRGHHYLTYYRSTAIPALQNTLSSLKNKAGGHYKGHRQNYRVRS